MTEELTQENFEEKIKTGNAIIDFYAVWCAPCKMITPIFEKMSKEFSDVNFFKANVDNNSQAANIYAVRSIPTIVFLEDGTEVDRVIGLLQEDDFKSKIKEVFK